MSYDASQINQALREGHAIANMLKRASTDSEMKRFEKEIDVYCDFVDETFGIIDEDVLIQEKLCELSFLLYLAVEAKRRHLAYDRANFANCNYELEEFEDYLDGKSWVLQ